MARSITYLTCTLVLVHLANSYVLLTANLEDVQAIVKEIADSPVVGQISQIWRRASNQFNQHSLRSHNDNEEFGDGYPHSGYQSDFDNVERRTNEANNGRRHKNYDEELVALGRNASFYLDSIKKMLLPAEDKNITKISS